MESSSTEGAPGATPKPKVPVPDAPPGHGRTQYEKGLKTGALGMMSSVVIGVASTAPAYSLAATLGLVAAAVGFYSPSVMIVAFIPMLLIASAYYYMNKADPDCGTSFSWVTRAFGPHTGWVTGWVIMAADAIVMANLAQVAGQYFFLLIGWQSAANSTVAVTAVGVLFIALMTWLTAVGIEISARTQWGLLIAELIVLFVFSITALVKVYAQHPAGSVPVSLSWFNPFNATTNALVAGVLLAVFIYWGWDTTVAVNEETKDSSRTPGIAAVVSTLLLLGTYLLITVAAQAFAGPDGLAKNSDDVFASIGTMVLGSTLDKLLVLAVLTSAIASTLTTILPLTRTALSMSVHGALPKVFAQVSPRYKTPLLNTVIFGLISIAWYVGLTIVSQNILYDSIASLGLMIAFYLGITGYAVPVFYRRTAFKGVKNFFMLFLFPVLGGVMLTYVFIKSLIDLWNPANSASGTSWFGIGPPFIIAVAFLVAGVVAMIVSQVIQPGFFRRKTETAETMTPTPEGVIFND
jgi:amino acid transporter